MQMLFTVGQTMPLSSMLLHLFKNLKIRPNWHYVCILCLCWNYRSSCFFAI